MFAAFLSIALSALVAPHEEKSFLAWMRSTNQLYTGDEYQLRFGIYLANSRAIQEHNKQSTTYKLALNKFAAYTPAEYNTLLGHKSLSKERIVSNMRIAKHGYPENVDWRRERVVNEVKDQSSCGSCWAFSVIQAMESQYCLAKDELLSLSESNLVDCVTVCYGCSGGDEYITYDWVLQNQDGYWNLEEDYPYEPIDRPCAFKKDKGVAKFSSWNRPAANHDEEQLAKACCQYGPISVAIDAGCFTFQLYKGGIYDDDSCHNEMLNHAVGLVGYGVENGVKYWIIRNSWGASWGEDGYIRMIRNGKDQCGVAFDCVLPVV